MDSTPCNATENTFRAHKSAHIVISMNVSDIILV